jgi:hypothetical protein
LLPVESEGKAGAAPQPINTVNAIRLKGFWRKKNEQNQNMVSELLKKLRENPGSFTFSFPGPDGKPVNLKDEQIVKELAVAGTGPELAFPFEIILPLAREVKAK